MFDPDIFGITQACPCSEAPCDFDNVHEEPDSYLITQGTEDCQLHFRRVARNIH